MVPNETGSNARETPNVHTKTRINARGTSKSKAEMPT
jgi:hypothetical protein